MFQVRMMAKEITIMNQSPRTYVLLRIICTSGLGVELMIRTIQIRI